MGVFHEGERAVQARAGVEAESRNLGRGISRAIPEGGGPFLEAERSQAWLLSAVALPGIDALSERARRHRGRRVASRGPARLRVRVLDERRLRIPNYAAITCSETLGNIAADPRAPVQRALHRCTSAVGLLFLDFDTGTRLQLTGRARILWEHEDYAELKGTDRAVEVEIEYSPFNPR